MDSRKSLKLCQACLSIDYFNLMYSIGDYNEPTSKDMEADDLSDKETTSNAKVPFGAVYEIIARAPDCEFCELVASTAKNRFDNESKSSLPTIWNGQIIRAYIRPAFFCRVNWRGRGRTNNERAYEFMRVNRLYVELKTCVIQHGVKCSSPPWLPALTGSGPQNLRLVDVHNYSLVDAPTHSQYLALSYVWGNPGNNSGRYSMLTKDKLYLLRHKNSITELYLPATVRDAIAFTRLVGQRYIWIDALCIVQDDDGEVLLQVNQMDIIYSSALLTIIVATGQDANSRFPGLYSPNRNVSQKHARVCIVPPCYQVLGSAKVHRTLSLMESTLQRSDQNIQNSKWNTRGWTFQERLLSRRALFITPAQIYWTCSQGLWDEETILETSNDKNYEKENGDDPNLRVLPQRMGCYDEFDSGEPRFTREALRIYITQYSLRRFTVPDDVRGAFSGTERRFRDVAKTKLHWGLVEDMFDQDLLFGCSGFRKTDCSYPMRLVGEVFVRIIYPSWSWMAWYGFYLPQRNDPRLREYRAGQLPMSLPLLLFYALFSDGSVYRIGCRPADQFEATPTNKPQSHEQVLYLPTVGTQHLSPGKSASTEADGIVDRRWLGGREVKGPVVCITAPGDEKVFIDQHKGLSLSPGAPSFLPTSVHDVGKLVFWTSHARIPTMLSRNSEPPRIEIMDRGLPTTEYASRELLNFIQLSSGGSGEGTKSEPSEPESVLLDYIVVASTYAIGGTFRPRGLGLLIIRWDTDVTNVCYRLGRADISEEAWVNYTPVWKMVILA